MRTRNHLGEIDKNGLLFLIDHDVKFTMENQIDDNDFFGAKTCEKNILEIAVDDAVIGQFEKQVHQFFVESTGILELTQLAPIKQKSCF